MPQTNQSKKLRTKAQNSLMFMFASKCGVSHEDLRDFASEVSGGRTSHTSELYFNEAQEIISRLEKAANPAPVSKRTVQYRRQKAGNVVNIETARQEKMLNEIWFAYPHRTAFGIEAICRRTIHKPAPKTTIEFNKIIEAVKSMNSREEAKSNPNSEITNPKSKEVA